MRQTLDESADLTPQERRQEIATILAAGVLRLRHCRHDSVDPNAAERFSDSRQDNLADGAE